MKRFLSVLLAVCLLASCLAAVSVMAVEELPTGRILDEDWTELTEEAKTFDDEASGAAIQTVANLNSEYNEGALTLSAIGEVTKGAAILKVPFANQLSSDGKYYMELVLKQTMESGHELRSYFPGTGAGNAGIMLTNGSGGLGGKFLKGSVAAAPDKEWFYQIPNTQGANANIPVSDGTWVNLGLEVDMAAKTVRVFCNGTEYFETPLGALAGTNAIDATEWRVCSQTFNAGDSVSYSDFKMWKYAPKTEPTDAEKLAADKAALKWEVIKGSNTAENNVTANLTLPGTIGENNTTVTWASNNAAIAENGTVNRPSEADASVTLTANLQNGAATDRVVFNLVVKKAEGILVQSDNLALGKNVTGDAEVYSSAYDYSKMVDGDISTRLALKDNVSLANKAIQIDLGEETKFNKITMTEFAARLMRWKYQYSVDGQTWTDIGGEQVQPTDVSGNNVHPEFVFDEVSARYVRILILENRDNKGVSIFEVGVYRLYAPNTIEEKLNYALGYLTEELVLNGQASSAVTNSVNLTTTVEGLENCTVVWKASPAGIIDLTTGAVTRRTSNVAVTLTAEVTVDGVSGKKEFALTVLKEAGDDDKAPKERKAWKELDSITFNQESEDAGKYFTKTASEYIEKSFEDGCLKFAVNSTTTRDDYTNDYLNIPFPDSYTTGKHYAEVTFMASLKGSGNDIIRMWLGKKASNADYAILPIIGDKLSVGKATLGSKSDTWLSGPVDQTYTTDEWHTFGVEFDCDAQIVRYYLDGAEIFTERQAADAGNPIKYAKSNPMSSWIWAFYKNLHEGHTIKFKEYSFWSLDTTTFQSDLDKLTYELLSSENREQITEDLNLPTLFEHESGDVTVTWTSSDESTIDTSGNVTQNEISDRTVVLSALVEQASTGLGEVKTFTFVVQRQGGQNYVTVEKEDFNDASALQGALVNGSAKVNSGRLELSGNPETRAELLLGAKGLQLSGTHVQFDLKLGSNSLGVQNEFALLDFTGGEILHGSLTEGKYSIHQDSAAALTFPYREDAVLAMILNTENKTAEIYLDGEKKGSVKLNGDHVSTICFTANGSGTMYVDDMTLAVKTNTPDAVKVQIDSSVLLVENLTDEAADYITKNLNLMNISGLTGSAIIWSSSKPDVMSNEGRVTRPEEDTQVIFTATFTSGTEKAEKDFVFTVKGNANEDFAYEAAVSASSAQAGSEAKNLTDGRADTGWIAAIEDENPSVMITLAAIKKISNVTLREEGSAVQAFTLEVSANGKEWSNVYTGAAIGAEKEIHFDSVEARYVRYTVTQKAEGATGLKAFEIRYQISDAERVSADYNALKLEYSADKKYILLPSKGVYGSNITWRSSHENIVDSVTGKITQPDATTVVTLTAVLSSGAVTKEKRMTITISGKGGNSGSGDGSSNGGGGSRGGVSLNNSTINAPVNPNEPGETTNPNNSGQTTGTVFADVPTDSWSYPYIVKAQQAGIISGDGSGNYYPQNNVTREEFVKMIVNALQLKTSENPNAAFIDVSDTDWFAPYVQTAYDNGIINGVTETSFGVGEYISRQDMATIIDRALDKTGRPLDDGDYTVFADAEDIAEYARASVGRLHTAKILEGSEGRFAPAETLTREQAAKVVVLILQ